MSEPAGLAADRADALVDMGRARQAVALLQQALAADPEDVRLWCGLARAHLSAGEPQWALGAADKALAAGAGLGGGDPGWAHRLRCVALRRLGHAPDAVAAAREAVGADPHRWQNHLTLAETLLQEPLLALPADEIPPAGAAARAQWNQLRHIRAGTAILEVALRAAAIAPDEPDVQVCLAWAHLARRENGEALAAVDRALALAPDNARAHSARAHLLRRRGRLASAATGFRRAAAIDPGGHGPAEFAAVCRRAVHLGFAAALLAWLVIGSIVQSATGQDDPEGLRGVPGAAVAAAVVLALFVPAAVVLGRMPRPDRAVALRTIRRDATLRIRFGALLGVAATVAVSGFVAGGDGAFGLAVLALFGVALAAGPISRTAPRRGG